MVTVYEVDAVLSLQDRALLQGLRSVGKELRLISAQAEKAQKTLSAMGASPLAAGAGLAQAKEMRAVLSGISLEGKRASAALMGMQVNPEAVAGAGKLSRSLLTATGRAEKLTIAATTYYQRQARYGYDDSMRWGVVPAMMLDRAGQGGSGGGSRGIGPSLAAVNRVVDVGIMNKVTAGWFGSLGMLGGDGKTLRTTTTGTLAPGLKNQKAWTANPFLATWSELVPALEKKYGEGILTDPQRMREAITASKMTQTAMSQFLEWTNINKAKNTLRDMANVGVLPDLKDLPPLLRQIAIEQGLKSHTMGGGAMGYEEAYQSWLKNDPRGAGEAVAAQWTALRAALGDVLMPALLPVMHGLAEGMHGLALWGRRHPVRLAAAEGVGAAVLVRAGWGMITAGTKLSGSALALGRAAAALDGAAGRLGGSPGGATGGAPAAAAGGGWLARTWAAIVKSGAYSFLAQSLTDETRAHPENYPYLQPMDDPKWGSYHPGEPMGQFMREQGPPRGDAPSAPSTVNLDGNATFSGDFHFNLGELGSMIQKYIATAVLRATGTTSSGARPDISGGPLPLPGMY